MKMPGWHVLFDRKKTGRPSALFDALARVRHIREDCDWRISTTPGSRAKRRERLLQARKSIHPGQHTIPYEVHTPGLARNRWLWPFGPYIVLGLAVIWVILAKDKTRPIEVHQVHHFRYQLVITPAVLTEDLALAAARYALSNADPKLASWTPVKRIEQKRDSQADGTGDTYLIRQLPTNPNAGLILFSDSQTNIVWGVSLQLQGNGISGTVSQVR